MSFTSNEKSYGGYSSFSPMRHAERSSDKKKEKNENIPKYVHDKVEEIMGNQKEKDEGKAWAVAWSIYCKYKKPGSPHCKKETDEYFPSHNKKASWTKKEKQKIKRITLKISGRLDRLSSEALFVVEDILSEHCKTEREKQIIRYMFTKGKIPSYMNKYAQEARILGRIAGKLHYEKRPRNITYDERRKAHKVLSIICKFCYVKWSSKVWARVHFASKDLPLSAIRIELLRLQQIKYSVEYSRLLRLLFP